jgi:hypothetical protein
MQSIKIPGLCLKLILKFIWEDKRLETTNKVVTRKNKSGILTLPDFTYHKATVLNIVWFLVKEYR